MSSNQGKENKILHVVAGATATGKTAFAAQLAREMNGILINADSRQIYRGLNIGTNKGELIAGQELQHLDYRWKEYQLVQEDHAEIWLLDLIEPNELFSVMQYQQYAFAAIEKTFQLGKTPILVGGSGMYIDAVLNPDKYSQVGQGQDDSRRLTLSKNSLAELQKMIGEEALAHLNESDRSNPRRLVNLLLRDDSGSEAIKTSTAFKPFTEAKLHYCELPRADLKKKIEERAAAMWASGLLAETQQALETFGRSAPGLTGSGYPIICAFLLGELPEQEARTRFAQAHWQVARKQLTWFKKYFVV